MNKLFHAVIYCAFHAILPTFISDCRLSQQEILLRSQDALCQTEAKTCYKKLNKYFFSFTGIHSNMGRVLVVLLVMFLIFSCQLDERFVF